MDQKKVLSGAEKRELKRKNDLESAGKAKNQRLLTFSATHSADIEDVAEENIPTISTVEAETIPAVTKPVLPSQVTEPVLPSQVTEPVLPSQVTELVLPSQVTEPVLLSQVTEPVLPIIPLSILENSIAVTIILKKPLKNDYTDTG